jgi:hypothetical protein
MFILIILGILALVAIIATSVAVAHDGYHRQPTMGGNEYGRASAAAQRVSPTRLA